jgi:hypothetical protein
VKSCPSCQQVYADDGPAFCTNDGTPLVASASDYGAGSAGYKWQTPGDQPPPPAGWQPPPPPPGWGQNPPGQYAPYGYGMPYPPTTGGEGVASGALFTGIGALAALALGYLLIFSGVSSFNIGLIQIGGIIVLLSLIAGLTALILGIVTISMSNRNPAVSKAKGIVGLCLGSIPLLLMIIGLIAKASH